MKKWIEFQTVIDTTTTPWYTYICKWEIGRATTSSYWQIKRIDSNWNKQRPKNSKWNPSDDFEFIADNKALYTYSYVS